MFTRSSRFLVAAISTLIFVSSAFAGAPASDYNFPYRNPYFATMLAAITKPVAMNPDYRTIEPLPLRARTPLLENKNKVTYGVLLQKRAAPLVFITPGLGGLATSTAAAAVAEQLYNQGFHVVTLPNPMSWQFSIGASTTGIVGNPANDIPDFYNMMVKITNAINVKVTSFGFVGYSLGGYYAGFLAKYDSQEKFFNFKRVVLINPPIDLLASIRTIDALAAVGKKFSASDRDTIWGRAINLGQKLLARPVDSKYYYGLDKSLNFTDDQLKFLVGSSFKSSLTDVIFTSQQINDVGVLKSRATNGQRVNRYAEINRLNFEDYITQIVTRDYARETGNNVDPTEFIRQNDLRTLSDYLHDNQNVYLMHNQDDFLFHSEYLEWLDSTFGDRYMIFPNGGHVGNLWFDVNQNYLKEILTGLKQ